MQVVDSIRMKAKVNKALSDILLVRERIGDNKINPQVDRHVLLLAVIQIDKIMESLK